MPLDTCKQRLPKGRRKRWSPVAVRGIQTILILECLGGPDIRNVSLDNEWDRYKRRNRNLINYTKGEFIVSGWERKRSDQ